MLREANIYLKTAVRMQYYKTRIGDHHRYAFNETSYSAIIISWSKFFHAEHNFR